MSSALIIILFEINIYMLTKHVEQTTRARFLLPLLKSGAAGIGES